MANGDLTLHRILENMVFNACQGDGKQGATQIDIKAHPGVSGETAILTIRDNGPGFPSSMLEKQHVDAFFTTKDEGTGLGLFTTERWVMASGGKLKLSNREEGGAQVEIILPQWA
jgi:C4-dicarboxylate-specific signal transduction histidine kinase